MNITSFVPVQVPRAPLPTLSSSVLVPGLRRAPFALDDTSPEVEAWFELFAPHALTDPERYRDSLYVYVPDRGEDGEVVGWKRLRSIRPDFSPRDFVEAHVEAGRANAPVLCDGLNVGAVGLSMLPTDLTNYVTVDLDGGDPENYPNDEIVAALRRTFGERAVVKHSGSGKKGRMRATMILDRSLPAGIARVRMLALLADLGWAEKKGALEVYPSTTNNRLPFGFGGCYLYDRRDPRARRLVPFDEIMRLIQDAPRVSLPPVRGEGDAVRRSYRFDPSTRRERPRSTPEPVRALWRDGLTGQGQRDRSSFVLIRDCLYSGLSRDQAIVRMLAWIDDGKADASADVRRNGREWFRREIPGRVDRVYGRIRALGTPDPVELSQFERARLRSHCEELAEIAEPVVSVSVLYACHVRLLAYFKGAWLAGLPMLRMHCRTWQSIFGRHYRRIRGIGGLFEAMTGYKSRALVQEMIDRGDPHARLSDAYSTSWSTSFEFDEPSVGVHASWSLAAASVDPSTGDEAFARWEEERSRASSCMSSSVDAPSASSSSRSASVPAPEPPRLYVHPSGNEADPSIESEDKTDRPIGRQANDRSEPPRPRRRPPPKGPKWQPSRAPEIPGASEMSLDEWLAAYDEVVHRNRARGRRRAAVTRRRNDLRRKLAEQRESTDKG